MSTTAKRILDVMSKYNTPLSEVRRVSNALPSISETSVLGKQRKFDLNTSIEIDKTKRALHKPNTPYNRPFGRNESILTTELHVPSMPELLQLKKFATRTIEIREAANKSDSVLNKPIAVTANQCSKIKSTVTNRLDGDLDESSNNNNNNNNSSSNKSNESSGNVVSNKQQHKNKIRIGLNKRKCGKRDENDELPEPVNLPNITLNLNKNIAPFEFQTTLPTTITDQKASLSGSNKIGNNESNEIAPSNVRVPFQHKSFSAIDVNEEKQRNGDSDVKMKKSDNDSVIALPITLQTTKNPFNSSSRTSNIDSAFKVQPKFTQPSTKKMETFEFAEPIIVPSSTASTNNITISENVKSFSFSEPIIVTGEKNKSETKEQPTTNNFKNFKFEPKPIDKITSDSGIADTTISFGSTGNKSIGLLSSTKETVTDAAKRLVHTLSESNHDNTDNTFKSITAKQKQGKWECSSCLVLNESTADKCSCCGTTKPQKSDGCPGIKAATELLKVVSPKGAPVGNVTTTTPQKPGFIFGSFPTSSTSTPSQLNVTKPLVDNVFKSIAAKQKSSTWECSACMTKNEMSKSKCICCEQARDAITSTNNDNNTIVKSSIPQSSEKVSLFGGNSSNQGLSSSVSSTQFIFGKAMNADSSVTPKFSFGNLNKSTIKQNATDEKKMEESNESKKEEAKESIKPTSQLPSYETSASTSKQFAFSSPLPVAPKTENIEKPAADNIFKKIVAEQSAKWECESCMTKNDVSIEKCVCCDTPKELKNTTTTTTTSISSSSEKKGFELPKSSFSFGDSIGSNPFKIGSASETKTETSSQVQPIFGTFSKPTSSFQLGSITSTTVSSSTAGTFSFSDSKTDLDKKPSTSTASVGLTFGRGNLSKDVTDTGDNSKNVKVLENVLVKPASNGPIATSIPTFASPQPTFIFGQNPMQNIEQTHKSSLKRVNPDSIEDSDIKSKSVSLTPVSSSSSPFVFGRQQQTESNIFSAIVSTPKTINSTQESIITTQKPIVFGGSLNQPGSTFATFSASKPFSFNTNSNNSNASATVTSTSNQTFGIQAPAQNTTSQPIFGTNAFPTASTPTLGGFKATSSLGSSATPNFGLTAQMPTQSTEVSL